MSMLEGKIAVVTGASSGIGLAIAKRLSEQGAQVFITGRREAELHRAAAELGARVTAVRGDASRPEDLDALFATVRAAQGKVDILIANAGKSEPAPLAGATEEHFDDLFALNVRATFFTVQKALPLLADGASVVLVGSAMHAKGVPGFSVYSATKAAVRSFARTFAAELKERQIRVNCLSPGAADTPMLVGETRSPEEGAKLRAQYGAWIPLGRVAQADEIASAALFLASPASSYLTGSDLVADGGFTQL